MYIIGMVLLNSDYRTDNVKVGRMSGLPAVSVVRHEKALSNLKKKIAGITIHSISKTLIVSKRSH